MNTKTEKALEALNLLFACVPPTVPVENAERAIGYYETIRTALSVPGEGLGSYVTEPTGGAGEHSGSLGGEDADRELMRLRTLKKQFCRYFHLDQETEWSQLINAPSAFGIELDRYRSGDFDTPQAPDSSVALEALKILNTMAEGYVAAIGDRAKENKAWQKRDKAMRTIRAALPAPSPSAARKDG